MSTESIGNTLRRLRVESKLPLRKVAAVVDVDVAILSKMERGERRLTKALVQKLAKLYKQNADELLVLYLRDKVLQEVGDDQLAIKALQVAEKAVSYNAISSRSKSSLVSVIKAALKSDVRVEGAWLFGSVARGEARPDSDVDIMVELNNKKKYSFFDLADIAHRIEQKINRKVDLVEKGSLKNFALDTAKNDWIKIYG
jgi:predicted nucleotidyltransferase/plasmid maintenance system antidote protein VapI